MNEKPLDKSLLQTLLPYIWAVAGGGLTYVSTIWWTGLSALSVAFALVLGIAIFVLTRLVQSRGKLSLKVTTFVLPLIVALLCLGLMQLNPFRQRHLTFEAITASDLQVLGSSPQILGEWYRDPESKMLLPVWLVRMCGENSMSPIFEVSGPLENLQGLNVSKLHLPRLRSIRLHRYEDEPVLSVDMIKSLCQLESLKSVEFEFNSITPDDLPALKELKNLRHQEAGVSITVPLDKISSNLRLDELPANFWVYFSGGNLNAKVASQVTNFPHIRFSNCTMSAEAVRSFAVSKFQSLHFENCVFDGDALARLSIRGVRLQNCRFAQPFSVGENSGTLHNLSISNTPITHEVLLKWIDASSIQWLDVDRVLTDTELEELKNLESIEMINYQLSNGESASYMKDQLP